FKGSLEKLEVEPEVIRHGKFKSAVEPFMSDKMSPENKAQIVALQQSIWNHIIENIGQSRKMSSGELLGIARDDKAGFPEAALELKLVDKVAYLDEVHDDMRKLLGMGEKEKLKLVTLKK